MRMLTSRSAREFLRQYLVRYTHHLIKADPLFTRPAKKKGKKGKKAKAATAATAATAARDVDVDDDEDTDDLEKRT